MNKKMAVAVCAAFLGATVIAGAAQAAEKLGYVDLSRIFAEYGKTKDYDKVLSDKEAAYTADRDKKVNEVKALQDKLSLLSDKEKEAKKGEMETKVKALQEYDRLKQADLRKEQDEKMREILKDIEDAVKQFSAKEGYTMIFNDRVLVYQAPNLNVTDGVMVILNKGAKPVEKAVKK
jgi:Skp family chaperone for outer membrane proteins